MIVDRPEGCRRSPIAVGDSSSSSFTRYTAAEAASSGKHAVSCPRESSIGSQMSSPPLCWSPASSLVPPQPKPKHGPARPRAGEGEHSVEVSGTPSSMSSSAAFESNMDDIERYVDQDLDGYGRLSY
ncbi:hypothetical protein BGZ72_005397 [Mortierella alpina]|nr:hypothetical protein BGZ72_005397 [Mortierella alpina]